MDAVMAKKRIKPGPKPSEEGPRESLVALKCRQPWKEWLERLSAADERAVPVVIERALKAYAASIEFPEVPPKR